MLVRIAGSFGCRYHVSCKYPVCAWLVYILMSSSLSGSGASASFAADGSSEKVNIYMTVLLIAIAVLAAIKTIGATICKFPQVEVQPLDSHCLIHLHSSVML